MAITFIISALIVLIFAIFNIILFIITNKTIYLKIFTISVAIAIIIKIIATIIDLYLL